MHANLMQKLASALMDRLFLTAPELHLTAEKAEALDAQYALLVATSDHAEAFYPCPYPKHEFLRYIVQEKRVLLHGSNHLQIDRLMPKQQTDWNGRLMEAVFASSDGIWPMFFATVDHANYRGSLRNGCFAMDADAASENRFYFFSLNAEYQHQYPWRDGMVYILPKDPFRKTSDTLVRFDEWVSTKPVIPLARLRVSPEDFPFWRNVAWHDEDEPIYTSWLRFKKRQIAS